MSDRVTGRPTMVDLARAAGVSPSTVDRVLNGRLPVRRDKAERVLAAAEAIGFRATGALRRIVGQERPVRTFGFLLQRESSSFYRLLGDELARATRTSPLVRGTSKVVHLQDLTAASVAERLAKLGRTVDAVAVVAADHPRLTQAIDDLAGRGVPVFALISNLTAESRAGYVGLDDWKVGRTAAWAVTGLSKVPGQVGILVGNHRYRFQEAAEMAFRSYVREHAPEFDVLEPVTSLEDTRFAYETTLDLLTAHPDLRGLFVNGGGVEGVLRALREDGGGRSIVTVAFDLTPETRAALIDGVLSLVLSHPREAMAQAIVAAMAEATGPSGKRDYRQVLLPADIVTPESV